MQSLKEYFKARILQNLYEKKQNAKLGYELDFDKIKQYPQGASPEYEPDALRAAADEIERRWSKPTMGFDPGTNERIIKGSPLDLQPTTHPLDMASTMRSLDDRESYGVENRLKDPLNIRNMVNAIKYSNKLKQNPSGAKTYDELDRESIERRKKGGGHFGLYGSYRER